MRLITSLGFTRYQTVSYQMEGKPPVEHSFVQVALCRWFPEVKEVVVLCTPTAWHGWIKARLPGDEHAWWPPNGDELERSLPGVPVRWVQIPNGESPGDQWRQFSMLLDELRSAPNEVILDITLGFRSYPFLAGAVLAFYQAADAAPRPVKLLYGGAAFGKVMQVWDLSEVASILNWSRRVDILLRTGRADEGLVGDVVGRGRALAADESTRAAGHGLRLIGTALLQYSADVETINTPDLVGEGGSASRLVAAIDRDRASVKTLVPGLEAILDRVRSQVEPLASRELDAPDGQALLASVARHYLDLGRYPEAMTVVREAAVSRYAGPAALRPGRSDEKTDSGVAVPFSQNARAEAENRWHNADPDGKRDIAQFRNAFDHAGFQAQGGRKSAALLKKKAAEYVGRLARPNGPMVNVSNRPSSQWSPEQTAAALALPVSSIIDAPFPQLGMDDGEGEVHAICRVMIEGLPAGAEYVVLDGDTFLTVWLANGLRAAGRVPLAVVTRASIGGVGGVEFVGLRRLA